MASFSPYSTELKQKGYSKLPIIDDNTKMKLLDVFNTQLKSKLKEGTMYWSMSDSDKEFAAKISAEIMPLLASYLSLYIEELIPITTSFMIKPANSPCVNFHQDWTFVDKEPEFSSYTCWIPLVDVNQDNGIMGFVPFSHQEYTFFRASPSPPFGHNFPETEEYFSRAQYISLKAGEPIVFNHRTVHGSKPNFTDQNRPAVALSFRQKGSTLIHVSVQANSNGKILNKYLIDESFFDQFSNDIIQDFYYQGKSLPNLQKIEDITLK